MPAVEPPRSWPKADKALFVLLPDDVQAIISRRENQRDRELRRLQGVVGAKHPIDNEAELIRIASTFRQGILGDGTSDGMSFTVAVSLSALLNSRGVRCELRVTAMPAPYAAYWPQHYWLELEDGRALDPACDHFGALDGVSYPEIYLGAPNAIIHKGKRSG